MAKDKDLEAWASKPSAQPRKCSTCKETEHAKTIHDFMVMAANGKTSKSFAELWAYLAERGYSRSYNTLLNHCRWCERELWATCWSLRRSP